MPIESKKQAIRRVMENAARDGFTHGFAEGGRYVISLLMGLPRPYRVVVDPSLEPGTCELRYGHVEGELAQERVQKLGDILDALRETDLKTALDPKEEISPARRLENVAAYVQGVQADKRSSQKIQGLMDEIMRLVEGEK